MFFADMARSYNRQQLNHVRFFVGVGHAWDLTLGQLTVKPVDFNEHTKKATNMPLVFSVEQFFPPLFCKIDGINKRNVTSAPIRTLYEKNKVGDSLLAVSR